MLSPFPKRVSYYPTYIVLPIIQLASGQAASRSVIAGENLNLSVNITVFNVPLTSITWLHEGNILSGIEDSVIIYTSPMLPVTSSGSVISTLKISGVQQRDAGTYTAISTYNLYDSKVQFTITVKGELAIQWTSCM